jgi:preprotein translocase subunit SecA
MTLEERRQALLKVDPSAYGLYDAEVKLFLQYFEDMARVKQLGGLHVVGSERHEARRIDNQLRGRAARQGDPGSSRFYLSLEDDLMRLFGGSQVSGLMERLKVDDSMPLEVRLVGNIIEGSQHRVEGANFDVRKHLLEYDDVLNKQRAQIYSQRDRIFVKEDLHEDLSEMLRAEVERRVTAGLSDEEGPWKLIAWLEQIQPPFMSAGRLYPTFGLSLLLERLASLGGDLKAGVVQLVAQAIDAEHAHSLRAIEGLIDKTEEGLEAQIAERDDALDAYFEGLRGSEERPRPQKIVEELSALARVPLKLSNEQQRTLGEDPEALKDEIHDMVSAQLTAAYASRVVTAIENRLGEPLGEKIQAADWDDAAGRILELARKILDDKRVRLVGENGQIARDVDALMPRDINDNAKLQLLISLSHGARTVFDQHTHRQIKQVFSRFSYVFLAAQMLEGRDAQDVMDDVVDHLEAAEEALELAWGQGEHERLSAIAQRLADFGPAARIAFGEERLNDAVSSLGESDREALVAAIGRYVLNEVHRQLLLGAITELWVDYLTRVEGLRVSIGLEAYAQRDPLVQYKSQASEMYQQLLADIRTLVIGRAFSVQPRRVEITPVEVAESVPAARNEDEGTPVTGNKKKRKRH